MDNLKQKNEHGVCAISSSLKRAELQNQNKVENKLFTPHIASNGDKSIANHQNYFRSYN